MNIADALLKATKGSTNKWAKIRKAEERQSSRRYSRSQYMYSTRVCVKDVAYKIMKQAYMSASDNGTLPANARQLMYAARPLILAEATADKFSSKYFTQHLLPDYLEEHPEETAGWDVVFDARGQLNEPHTKKEVRLGTVRVREYLGDIRTHQVPGIVSTIDGGDAYPTMGPKHRYGAILFIEKEGFNELFERAEIAKKYDICIMSTKGMSVTAARTLVDELCVGDLPLFVLHDFDKSGFSIIATLSGKDTRRYTFQNRLNVIDMGLRLEDVEEYKLESETVSYGKSDPTDNLRENGATQAEIDFLCGARTNYWQGYSGRRVELNALGSRNLLNLIESKLKKNGVEKIIPDHKTLENAFHRSALAYRLNEKIEEIREDVEEELDDVKITAKQLEAKVKRILKKTPTKSWDDAITEIVEDNHRDIDKS